ncbi:MAG TPA: hypothetical protein PLH57_04285 [Oligoflexia bacterium]|nr:hypothetical protein [Oligoflexia bacterium]
MENDPERVLALQSAATNPVGAVINSLKFPIQSAKLREKKMMALFFNRKLRKMLGGSRSHEKLHLAVLKIGDFEAEKPSDDCNDLLGSFALQLKKHKSDFGY